MNEKDAREILKPFEAYKVFPLAWLPKDEQGNPSAMATAEAKGYLECLSQVRPLIEASAKMHRHLTNEGKSDCECAAKFRVLKEEWDALQKGGGKK